jgi:hypothetical protein
MGDPGPLQNEAVGAGLPNYIWVTQRSNFLFGKIYRGGKIGPTIIFFLMNIWCQTWIWNKPEQNVEFLIIKVKYYDK